MSVLTLEAKLERQDSTTPWGFRMQGGKDFSSPITIARVNPGSLAAKCGLQQGDIILKIGSKASETLKHKDAQDVIVSYGNKLDLLLQRIREKKKTQNGYGVDFHHHGQDVGGGPTSQSYDKFSTPTIASYQTPAAPAPAPSGQGNMGFNSMNSAPKPFGSVAAPVTNKPSPAPYNPPAPPAQPSPAPYNPPAQHSPAAYNPPPPAPMVDNLSQQTSNMNINAGNNFASKYSNVEEKQGPGSHQSRSFKFLQDTLDSGQDPPAALRPTVDLRRSPSPHANAISATTGPSGVQKQFNSPIGLYSSANIPSQLPPPPAEMINDKSEGISNSGLDEEPAMKFDAQGKRLYRPSETFKLIHEQENPSSEPQDKQPEVKQTRTIRVLEKQLGDALPAPAAAKAPSAPKPGVWSPAGGSSAPPASAPAMRSFTQNAGPAAPPPSQAAPPRSAAAPPKPTGVGAVRGNIGDAVVKKNETGLVPVCTACGSPIRGPFVTAMGKSWCPDHFICANPRCGNKLMDMGFVEESGFLYCEKDYEMYFAPKCTKCVTAIVGECVNALNKQYHPACFLCHHCKQPIGGTQFHLEEGNPYCEIDWRQLFQTMCSSCNFPIEPGDKWVEALSNNYHSECFNCSTCQVNLEGQAFYAKTGKPYCKKHAR